MAEITLRSLVSKRSGNLPVLAGFIEAAGEKMGVTDPSGKLLWGDPPTELAPSSNSVPVIFDEEILGFVSGPIFIAKFI